MSAHLLVQPGTRVLHPHHPAPEHEHLLVRLRSGLPLRLQGLSRRLHHERRARVPVGCFRLKLSKPHHLSHQGKHYQPPLFLYNHFIHPYARASRTIRALNRLGARELSIARAAKCITTLRVASRSGGCLIRHEQPTEPGEKNADEPCAALARSSRLGHLNLLVQS